MAQSIDILSDFGKNCISISDGQRLYEKIFPALQSGEIVVLNFKGVDILATPFLNSAFGQLLKDFDRNKIKTIVEFRNKPADFDKLLSKVISNAESFYSDPKNKAKMDDLLKKNLDGEN